MEKLLYEIKPYVYLFGGGGAILSQRSALLYVSCVTLIICALAILHARYAYRRLQNPFK